MLAADEGNLTGALEWAQDRGQAARVADLAHGLRLFWYARVRRQEGIHFLARGVAAMEANMPVEAGGAVQRRAAELHLASAQFLVYNGKPKPAEEAGQGSLEEFRAMHDRRGEGAALSIFGEAHLCLGKPVAAESYLQKALAIRREVGERPGEGNDLGVLGQVAQLLHGEYAVAKDYVQQSLAIAREVHDRRLEGIVLTLLGQAHSSAGSTRLRRTTCCKRWSLLAKSGTGRARAQCWASWGRLRWPAGST